MSHIKLFFTCTQLYIYSFHSDKIQKKERDKAHVDNMSNFMMHVGIQYVLLIYLGRVT